MSNAKIVILDTKKSSYVSAYTAAGKSIVHASSRKDLEELTAAQAIALHNGMVADKADHISDVGEDEARNELWEVIEANLDDIGVVPPATDSDEGKGGKAAAKSPKSSKAAAAKEKTPKAKGRGNAANLVPRKRKYDPETKIQFMKSAKSPFLMADGKAKKESNRSKIFDVLCASATLDEFYKTCAKKELVCGNYDIENALESGCIKFK